MPRTYQRTVRKKPLKKYTDNQINLALEDKTSGMSYRDCSKKYGIPVTVLHRHNKFKELNPGKNMKPQGGQTILSKNVEKLIVESLITCSSWGYPLTTFDLRLIVKSYLNSKGTNIKKFKDNMPGVEYAMCFLRRHKDTLSQRLCQNIKRSRTQVSREDINEYFNNLEQSLINIPPCNILNYDETNLCDDPGRIKVISKRGCKYPERVMNHSKSCTSVMFSCTGDGELLPPYTVYKALHMYTPWIVGGPKNSRYNRSKSGWFDSNCFEDWLIKIVIPHFKNKPDKKILIGDNLSSHLTITGIQACSRHNIAFVFLPPNSTHLTQPLDVSFFRPLKIAWRHILTTWKTGAGKNESAVPKSEFPRLLNFLMNDIKKNQINNILSGFKKCGIIPINRENVLNCLPPETIINDSEDSIVLNTSLISILKEMRYSKSTNKTRQKRQRLDIEPGKSVEVPEMEDQIFSSDEEEQMH